MPRRRIELGVTSDRLAASQLGRRQVLAAVFGILTIGMADAGEQRRFRIAFANLNDDPSARVEGLGFSGAEVRRSFELASRTLPVDMIYYDNGGDPEAALANAYDAIGRKVDLFIEYNSDTEANAEIARKLEAAAIPVLAVNYPVPGAPLYTADNTAAGQIAGKALGEFAKQSWADQTVVAVIAGDLGDPAAYLPQRVQGIIDGLHKNLPDVAVTRARYQRQPDPAGRAAQQIPAVAVENQGVGGDARRSDGSGGEGGDRTGRTHRRLRHCQPGFGPQRSRRRE